jgi:hypothetical protein
MYSTAIISVLIIVAAYRSKDNPFLRAGVERWRDMACFGRFNVSIIVQTVDAWTPEEIDDLRTLSVCLSSDAPLDIRFETFPEGVKMDLTRMHRSTVRRFLDEYDLFVYQEDDMAITADHIDMFLEYTAVIERVPGDDNHNDDAAVVLETNNLKEADDRGGSPFDAVGFVRFEELVGTTTLLTPDGSTSVVHSNGGRFIIEMPQQIFMPRCINGVPFLADEVNPHQALWMMTREQLKRLDGACSFFDQGPQDLAESRGMMVFMSSFSVYKADPRVLQLVGVHANSSCDVNKVVPAKEWFRAGVHHSRQRYAADYPRYTDIL